MTVDPLDAVRRARRAAAQALAEGAYREAPPVLDASPSAPLDTRMLARWSIIEADLTRLRSTRRLGRPITLTKRALARFMRQYTDDVLAQQSRFNARVVAHVEYLDARVAELEAALAQPRAGE